MKLAGILSYLAIGLNGFNGQVIDEHGCLSNKGYSWCVELNACIKPDITECNAPQNIVDCSPQYTECNSPYVCPKVEILDCEGGKIGYTRYRLSVVLKDIVKNVYVIYGGKGGDDNSEQVDIIVPPAYNVNDSPYSSDIGGINPIFYTYNEDLIYDSWLTIGITDGDPHNLLSTIGVDYSAWNINSGLDITNGALFVMDPQVDVIEGREYILGQLTLSDDIPIKYVQLNLQGKLENEIGNWDQRRVTFRLETPTKIPEDCMIWFDGCQSCLVRNGIISECTDLTCNIVSNKRCLRFTDVSH